MQGGVKVLSVRGIPVRLHWTFFLIVPYVAYSMARRFTALSVDLAEQGHRLLLPPLAWGLVLALLLFGSVLLHELGHVFVALAQGSRVREINLMMLGGVSHIESVSHAPRAEAKMAVVGPLVSVVIALVAYVAHLFTGAIADLQFGLYYLAQINLAIGIFNMLPAFPLDGGRVLRSMLAPRFGRLRATAIAANVGRVLALLMGVFGLLSGNFLLALIAVFVWGGGAAEASGVMRRERLAGIAVGELTDDAVPTLFAAETIARAAEVMLSARKSVVIVRGPRGRMGLITAEQIASIADRYRGAATIDTVATFDVPVARASDPAAAVLDAMEARAMRYVPVFDGDDVVGVMSRDDITRYLQLETMLRPGAIEHDEPEGRPSRA